MAASSYADYMVAQLQRMSRMPIQLVISGNHLSDQLSFQALKLPWTISQWVISGVLVLSVSLALGIINFWVLFLPAIIGGGVLAAALYNDSQRIAQIARALPPPEPLRQMVHSEPVLSVCVRLIGIQGELARRTLEFNSVDQEITIGRSSKSSVHLSETAVSRSHARIVCADGRWYVQDCESKTGVFVNDKKVNGGQRIHQHDRIRIGSSEFEFQHQ